MATCHSSMSWTTSTVAEFSWTPCTATLSLHGRRGRLNYFSIACERGFGFPKITVKRIAERRKYGSRGSVQKRTPLSPGIVQPRLPVPNHIVKPPYVNSTSLPDLVKEHQIHDAEGLIKMRAACQLAARVLEYAGTLVKGYHGDTSKTFLCGNVDEEAKRLVEVAEECLYKGISVCKAGKGFKQIGKKINKIADKYGYRVDKRFVGHGVGKVFHSEPIICHFRNDMPGCMAAGQTFTIEPILTAGSTECIVWEDNWTTVTADGSLAAQFEHTILITESGAEILTTC